MLQDSWSGNDVYQGMFWCQSDRSILNYCILGHVMGLSRTQTTYAYEGVVATMATKAINAACRKLGYNKLTEEQEMAVKCVMNKQDIFISLPTGSGKSLCYAILPLVHDFMKTTTTSIVLVIISPLISLIHDQVRQFSEKGLRCGFLGMDMNPEILEEAKKGSVQLLLCSPEACLTTREFRDLLLSEIYQKKLVCISVDEAHCVDKW